MGKPHKRLSVTLPSKTAHVWSIYVDIANCGGFTIQSLDSYLRLRNKSLSKYELDLLISIHSESFK